MRTQSAPPSSYPDRARHLSRRPWLPWLVFAAGVVYAGWYLVVKSGKGLIFFYDEWSFLLGRTGHSPGVFLRPHNEHLSAIPIAFYKLMLKLFGLGHYGPYQWMLMLFLVGLAVVVYLYARERVGPWLGLVPPLVVLLGGAFWEDTMWPFQIGFIGSLACGVGAFMALDRRSRRGDIVACILLVLGIGQSSIGLPFLAGVVLELLIRRDWRRFWVPIVPIVLYGIWKIAYPVKDFHSENIPHVPSFVFKAAAGASGSIFGVNREPGKVLALLFVALAVEAVLRHRTGPRFWALVGTLFAFWIAAGLARADLSPPDSSRYLLPGATLIMLAASETLRGVRLSRLATLAIIAVLPLTVTVGHDLLHNGASVMYTWAPDVRADVTALNAIEGKVRVDPTAWQVDPLRAPDITAAKYYDTASRYGHAGEPIAKLRNESPEARGIFDAVVLYGTGTQQARATAPPPTARPPQVTVKKDVTVKPKGPCLSVRGGPTGAGLLEVVSPPGGLHYRSATGAPSIGLRRWGDAPYSFGAIPANQWLSVVPPDLAPPGQWYAQFPLPSGTTAQVCGS